MEEKGGKKSRWATVVTAQTAPEIIKREGGKKERRPGFLLLFDRREEGRPLQFCTTPLIGVRTQDRGEEGGREEEVGNYYFEGGKEARS